MQTKGTNVHHISRYFRYFHTMLLWKVKKLLVLYDKISTFLLCEYSESVSAQYFFHYNCVSLSVFGKCIDTFPILSLKN